MKRQGMEVSIDELRNLADELESQCRQLNLELNIPKYDCNHKFQINIVNEEGWSDTWKIEHDVNVATGEGGKDNE